MPRQARLDAPGTLHHVIVRGIERGRIVKKTDIIRLSPCLFRSLGAPTYRESVGGMEVWTYYHSYGMRGNAYANAYVNPYVTSVNAWGGNRQWEM